jgi:hypothetical protein
MKMTKETKLYVGIGVTAVIIYLLWTNRSKFGAGVTVDTPLGGVRASAGGGQISFGVNPPAPNPMAMADMTAMNGGMMLPDGMMVQQAV